MNGLSLPAEVKDRCRKRNTKIKHVLTTKTETLVLIFTDGTQANVDAGRLGVLYTEAPELFVPELQSSIEQNEVHA